MKASLNSPGLPLQGLLECTLWDRSQLIWSVASPSLVVVVLGQLQPNEKPEKSHTDDRW